MSSPLKRWGLTAVVVLGTAAGLCGSWASERAAALGHLAGQDLRSGNLKVAQAETARALRWHPHDAGLWRLESALMGTVAFLQHDRQAGLTAVMAARQAWTVGPNDGRNSFELGWTLLNIGQAEAALAPLLAAVRLDPYNQSYLYALGRRSETAGLRRDAVHWYRAAWSVSPNGVVGEALDRLGAAP